MGRLLLELGPCLLLGLVLGQRRPRLADRLAPWLLTWGVPLSLTGLLLRAGLQRGSLAAGLLTLVLCSGGLLLTRSLRPLHRWLPQRALQIGAVVGNTAYVGLPVAIALLPAQALSVSISVDLVGTMVTWTLGPLLLAEHDGSSRWRWLPVLLSTPVCRALLLAAPLAFSPWGPWLGLVLWWPARLVLWLLLLLVGMRLGALLARLVRSEGMLPWLRLLPAVLIKLMIWPALVWLIAAGVALPPLASAALVLQAATPTAMSVLLLTESSVSERRAEEVASAARLVLATTLVAVFSLPLWGLALQAHLHG